MCVTLHVQSVLPLITVLPSQSRFGRTSLIVFALAAVIGASGILIPTFGIVNLVEQLNQGQQPFHFVDFCSCA